MALAVAYSTDYNDREADRGTDETISCDHELEVTREEAGAPGPPVEQTELARAEPATAIGVGRESVIL